MDSGVVSILLPAFFECLILVGIHAYLGLHVIRREIIFVDLALAQTAALGGLIAFLFGIAPHSFAAYWFSLGLTTIGAAIFAVCRFREGKVPQEAVIGLIYAISAALAILLIDRAPHGAEQLKDILTGSLLWVKWGAIATAAIVYSAVGIVHYIFRRQFWLISEDPEEARRQGMNVAWWDFLFFFTFGLVITLSVDIAGVLIVFVFLVAPAVIAVTLTGHIGKQLAIGWLLGLVVTLAGLFASYQWDLPTGPAIIGCYAAALLMIGAVIYNLRADNRRQALLRTIAFPAALAVMFKFIVTIGEWLQRSLVK